MNTLPEIDDALRRPGAALLELALLVAARKRVFQGLQATQAGGGRRFGSPHSDGPTGEE